MRSLVFLGVLCVFALSAGSSLAQTASATASKQSWVGPYVGAAAAYSNVSNTNSDFNPSGFSGVALFGANLIQSSNIVFGIEGATSVFGSVKDRDASVGSAWSISARAGLASDDIMPFLSAGIGQGEGIFDDGTSERAYFTNALVGGGIEGRLTSSVNWRLEGIWSSALSEHELGGVSVKPSAIIVRTGLIYKFN